MQRFTREELAMPMLLFGMTSAPFEVSLFRITYETVDAAGALTVASGAVAIPEGQTAPAPLVSYQHGTIVQKTNVPSEGGREEFAGVPFAADGYVAAMPDYLGLGQSDGLHPFVHAETEATAVVDMLRASKTLAAVEGIALDGQLFLLGYSQGGHATMAAHRLIEAEHAGELEVIGSAPMAGPYDLSGSVFEIVLDDAPYTSPFYLPYLLLAYNDIYALFPTDAEMFVEPYASQLGSLFNGMHTGDAINEALPEVPSRILDPQFLEDLTSDPDHALIQALRENDLFDWQPRAPIRLVHCSGDRTVPISKSELALQKMGDSGATIELVEPRGGAKLTHLACAVPSLVAGKQWLDSLR